MRPPIIATVTYTPVDPIFMPVVFDIYTSHTKPAYGYSANARPPGTVAGAANNSVVYYELRSIEQNLAAGANKMIIGDLNADCTSYPGYRRGTNFAGGWNWYINYGQKTNTAPGSSCAYDRIILNNALQAFYQAHGIFVDHYGNATRIDTQRVSDHFPVWVQFGETQAGPPPPVAAPVLAAALAGAEPPRKRRKFLGSQTISASGAGLLGQATSAKFFVTSYTTSRNYKSNFTYDLVDVRGAPTPVTTNNLGDIEQTITWASPPAGSYVFVFDANGDDKFSLRDGDFANFATQADLLVTTTTSGHNDLVTLGDNMVLRDVFDLSQAFNIYALAKNLPADISGKAYIVSDLLLKNDGYANWAQARAAGINLPKYSIPIQLAEAGVITTSGLTDDDRRQDFTTNSDGETFFSVWPNPGQLTNASVNYATPPDTVFDPAYAGTGDPPSSPDDTDTSEDPCEDAATSADDDFGQACNMGFLFGDAYGNTFNVVLDLDGDGTLGPSDPIDLRDIGDMKTFFDQPGNTNLGPNANGNPAVSEYKEYLERALSVTLSANDNYDPDTRAASARYTCGPELSKDEFNTFIVPDSQTGFRVLETGAYHSDRTHGPGLYQFGDAYLNDWSPSDGAAQCISGNKMNYSGTMNIDGGSKVVSVAESHSFENVQITANSSTTCWAAVEATAGTAIAVGAGSGFFTLGTGFLAGAFVAAGTNIVGAVECGF
ncbi:MAG: endonuclease/exonuclease/phosphatase family protein [Sulfitobacter sp.]